MSEYGPSYSDTNLDDQVGIFDILGSDQGLVDFEPLIQTPEEKISTAEIERDQRAQKEIQAELTEFRTQQDELRAELAKMLNDQSKDSQNIQAHYLRDSDIPPGMERNDFRPVDGAGVGAEALLLFKNSEGKLDLQFQQGGSLGQFKNPEEQQMLHEALAAREKTEEGWRAVLHNVTVEGKVQITTFEIAENNRTTYKLHQQKEKPERVDSDAEAGAEPAPLPDTVTGDNDNRSAEKLEDDKNTFEGQNTSTQILVAEDNKEDQSTQNFSQPTVNIPQSDVLHRAQLEQRDLELPPQTISTSIFDRIEPQVDFEPQGVTETELYEDEAELTAITEIAEPDLTNSIFHPDTQIEIEDLDSQTHAPARTREDQIPTGEAAADKTAEFLIKQNSAAPTETTSTRTQDKPHEAANVVKFEAVNKEFFEVNGIALASESMREEQKTFLNEPKMTQSPETLNSFQIEHPSAQQKHPAASVNEKSRIQNIQSPAQLSALDTRISSIENDAIRTQVLVSNEQVIKFETPGSESESGLESKIIKIAETSGILLVEKQRSPIGSPKTQETIAAKILKPTTLIRPKKETSTQSPEYRPEPVSKTEQVRRPGPASAAKTIEPAILKPQPLQPLRPRQHAAPETTPAPRTPQTKSAERQSIRLTQAPEPGQELKIVRAPKLKPENAKLNEQQAAEVQRQPQEALPRKTASPEIAFLNTNARLTTPELKNLEKKTMTPEQTASSGQAEITAVRNQYELLRALTNEYRSVTRSSASQSDQSEERSDRSPTTRIPKQARQLRLAA